MIRFFLLAAVVIGIVAYFLYYRSAVSPRSGTVEWIDHAKQPSLRFMGGRYSLDKGDALPIAILMAIWAVIAFWNLGDTQAPQTFHQFADEAVVINLNQQTELDRVYYYTGLGTGSYTLELSADGITWSRQADMEQTYANLFKWRQAELDDNRGPVRYLRVSAGEGSPYLGELAIWTANDQLLDANDFTLTWQGSAGTDSLFDEQSLVPVRPTYLNSAYFDEIYHARTAYEHLEGVKPYEVSHPPLGKVIISIGIAMFGMAPFGWRFMGTLFGVLMVGCFYALVKGMFGKRPVAVCGTLVFSFDFMHYVQTRISTIDTYAVFFIILMYLFLYRYISLDYETPFRKTLPPLLLSGLCFGLGVACKWTCIYAGAGLALLYAVYQVLRGLHHHRTGQMLAFWNYLISTIAVSLVFFLLIPGLIYYLSYIPYGIAQGQGPTMLFTREYLDIVVENQRFMLGYHSGVTAEHPYASRWYKWLFNIRPILYYRDYLSEDVKSAFSAFGNPAVYWGGLVAMVTMPISLVRRKDGRALAILVGYLALLVPWMVISRPTFAYHYFTNTVFLVLAICYTFNLLFEHRRGPYRAAVYGFTGVTIGLFILFYPSLSGMPVSTWYTDTVLRWLSSWPL